MIRAVSMLLFAGLVAFWTGCASNRALIERLDLLENEMADLHQANRKVNQRIDELQIQLSLIEKKLARRGEAQEPDLRVVKLRPGKTTKKRETRIKFWRKPGSMKAIDPHQVSERLPIDARAARRTLWGRDADQ